MWKRLIYFGVLNFGALGLGSLMMDDPGSDTWYQQLNRAPWEPPGWVFGAAWFTVMACFSVFMALITEHKATRRTWIVLFAIQWILNVSWNPVFFRFHEVLAGVIILVLLLVILLLMGLTAGSQRLKTIPWLLPYVLWLCVALSLNGYIYIKN
jgi:benzodiazapine receptor